MTMCIAPMNSRRTGAPPASGASVYIQGLKGPAERSDNSPHLRADRPLTTTIEFFGQACVVLDTGEFRLATDPWFLRPACVGATLPLPHFTTDEWERVRAAIDSCTHIYVSHDHEDHFDPWFLRGLSAKTLLVGRFQNSKFIQDVRRLGDRHHLVFLGHHEMLEPAPGIRLRMYLEQPPYRTNSMLLTETPDVLILHGNDCGIDQAVLEDVRGIRRPDQAFAFLYTLNLLGAGWFWPYLRRTSPDLDARVAAVRADMLTSHRRLLQMLEPTVTAFYAGPLVLRDRINTYINAIPEACDYSGLLRDLATVGPVMWPGPFSKLTFAAQRLVQTDLVDWLEYRDRPLRTLPDDAVDHYAEPVTVEDALGSARMYACELVDAQRRLGLEIITDLLFSAVPGFDALEDGIPCWQIAVLFHSAGGEVREITPDAGIAPPFLQVVSTPKIIQLVFQNRESWESFYGGRGRLRRVPDCFDNALHLCMRYARDPLSREALRRDLTMRRRIAAQPETFTVAHGGQQYTLLRRCPHEGEDLTKAEIKDGVVVCPRHQWRFDIETGACLRGDPRCSIRADATSSALTAAVQD